MLTDIDATSPPGLQPRDVKDNRTGKEVLAANIDGWAPELADLPAAEDDDIP